MKEQIEFFPDRTFTIAYPGNRPITGKWTREGFRVKDMGGNIREIFNGMMPLATVGSNGQLYAGSARIAAHSAPSICPEAVWVVLVRLGIITDPWFVEVFAKLSAACVIRQGGTTFQPMEVFPLVGHEVATQPQAVVHRVIPPLNK